MGTRKNIYSAARALTERGLGRTFLWPHLAVVRGRLERRLKIVYGPHAYWQTHAAAYAAERRGRPVTSEQAELALLLRSILDPAPSRIVEVGCAHGRTLARVAAAAPDGTGIIGVDFSAAMLEQARAQLPVRAVALVAADAGALPLPPASAEAVYTFGLLMHVPPAGIDAVIGELCRVSAARIFCLEPTLPVSALSRGSRYYQFDRRSFAYDYRCLFARRGWQVRRLTLIGNQVGILFGR